MSTNLRTAARLIEQEGITTITIREFLACLTDVERRAFQDYLCADIVSEEIDRLESDNASLRNTIKEKERELDRQERRLEKSTAEAARLRGVMEEIARMVFPVPDALVLVQWVQERAREALEQ